VTNDKLNQAIVTLVQKNLFTLFVDNLP